MQVISLQGSLRTITILKQNCQPQWGVYSQRNAAAAAVAAHECGHAVQHAQGYEWLQMRSTLVPIVSVASNFSVWVIMGGLILMQPRVKDKWLLLQGYFYLVWQLV